MKRLCVAAAFCAALLLAYANTHAANTLTVTRRAATATRPNTMALDKTVAFNQAPADDRRLVTDRKVLLAMGFPPDAQNVYIHSSVFSEAHEQFGFGPGSNYTSIGGRAFIGRQSFAGNTGEYSGGEVGCCENLNRLGAESFADAEFLLPPGVAIQSIRYWAHDVNAASDMGFFFFEDCTPTAGAGATTFTVFATGTTTGSSGYQGGLLTGSLNVNNRDCTYHARVRFDANSGLTFQKFRVDWRRQVSPAPGVATFLDVPTSHFFFRWIEALAAAGITAGCGGGNFCPDATVTRAQMAVFLSVALGLQSQ